MRQIIWCLFAACFLVELGLAQDDTAPEVARPERPDADQFQPTNRYVHKWIKLPEVSGENATDGSTMTIRTRPGYATVVLFLASYDEPSQEILRDFMRMEEKFTKLSTDFYYVFTAGDVRADVLGFMKEHSLARGMMSNKTIDENFHAPPLPAIYIADRRGWLTKRYLTATEDAIKDMEQFLDRMTSL